VQGIASFRIVKSAVGLQNSNYFLNINRNATDHGDAPPPTTLARMSWALKRV